MLSSLLTSSNFCRLLITFANSLDSIGERGISLVSALTSSARGPSFNFPLWQGKFQCPNTLSLVLFAGMTLDRCAVLRIGTLTGYPLCRESHPSCRLKNPLVIKQGRRNRGGGGCAPPPPNNLHKYAPPQHNFSFFFWGGGGAYLCKLLGGGTAPPPPPPPKKKKKK